jgi:hypothetical protein
MLRRNFPFLPGLASTSLPTLNLDFIRLPPHAHIESTRHLQNGIVDDFGVHPPRTNSVDQSNKSGWVGLDPVLPKLAGVFHQSRPEMVLPDAIDHYSGGERVAGLGEPFGQRQAATTRVGRPNRLDNLVRLQTLLKHRRHSRCDLGTKTSVISAAKYVRRRGNSPNVEKRPDLWPGFQSPLGLFLNLNFEKRAEFFHQVLFHGVALLFWSRKGLPQVLTEGLRQLRQSFRYEFIPKRLCLCLD